MWQDNERLGELATRFRGTWRKAARQAITTEYSESVDRLIQSSRWHEMPAPEDQLPDDWMPKAFFEYWSRRQGGP
jgi:hypothetical protein